MTPFPDMAFGARLPLPAGIAASRRRKLWEIAPRYHCPIIGTCLSVAELRKLARRAGLADWDSASDYALHSTAVSLARERNALSEAIQKALTGKFEAVTKRFARAGGDGDVLPLWRAALAGGEVAGALWAVLSHGRVSDALAHAVYEDVHMLSHQVGAEGRADLRKLAGLAADNEALNARLVRQRSDFASQLAERDAEIHALNARLAEALGAERRKSEAREAEHAAVPDEKSMRVAGASITRLEQAVAELRRELSAAHQELAAAEAALENLLAPPACASCAHEEDCAGRDFSGRCVLCVGGRTGLADHYRQMVERSNGRFMHHDGGLEDNPKRLQALLAAADAVICPADHVSHGAYYAVKRMCKQYGKPCVLLRSSGLSSFAHGLAKLSGTHGE